MPCDLNLEGWEHGSKLRIAKDRGLVDDGDLGHGVVTICDICAANGYASAFGIYL